MDSAACSRNRVRQRPNGTPASAANARASVRSLAPTARPHSRSVRRSAGSAGRPGSPRYPISSASSDHSSAEVYQGYLAQPPDAVLTGCRRISAQLIDGTWTLPDEDLLDPARHPWLNGRLLWLQIVVRGFWHPTGHLGDYYLAHGQPGRAVALQAQGLAVARYLDAPAAAAGMAGHSLACAQAQAGQLEQAARTLAEAIEANPDLRANASRDRDLEVLREAIP